MNPNLQRADEYSTKGDYYKSNDENWYYYPVYFFGSSPILGK